MAVSGFRQTGTNIDEDTTPGEAEDLHRQLEGRIGPVVGMQTLSVRGEMHWSIFHQYFEGDEEIFTGQHVLDRPAKPTWDSYLFSTGDEWEAMKADIDSGKIQPTALMEEILDGIRFSVRVYELSSREFGPIIFMEGEPSR